MQTSGSREKKQDVGGNNSKRQPKTVSGGKESLMTYSATGSEKAYVKYRPVIIIDLLRCLFVAAELTPGHL